MPNIVQLIFLIFGPITFSSLFIIAIFGKKTIRSSTLLNAFALHPDIGLARQGLFWWSICTPAVYFLVFGIISWQGHEISITPEGFKNFLSISALPLGLLSLAIPLGVTVARFHSTEQTAKQIFIAKHKNNLDAFYSHRKEFFAYFDQIGNVPFLDTFEVKYKINPKLHGRIFTGKAEDGTPDLNKELVFQLIGYLNSARKFLNAVLLDETPGSSYSSYAMAARDVYWIAKTLGVREIKDELYKKSPRLIVSNETYESDLPVRGLGATTTEAIAAFRCVKSYMLTILHFAGDSEYIEMIHRHEIPYIDITRGYMSINQNGLVIEKSFSSASGPLWETVESKANSWF
ncbi:hypothetical protein [Pseudomonas farris]